MSEKTHTPTAQPAAPCPASLVWFEIPADDIKRAQAFYGGLFGWKFSPIPGAKEYWHMDTGGADASPDGGMMLRQCAEQRITNYINVPSIDDAAKKIESLGGKITMPKTPVPGMGFFSICLDTENNTFALWQAEGECGGQ